MSQLPSHGRWEAAPLEPHSRSAESQRGERAKLIHKSRRSSAYNLHFLASETVFKPNVIFNCRGRGLHQRVGANPSGCSAYRCHQKKSELHRSCIQSRGGDPRAASAEKGGACGRSVWAERVDGACGRTLGDEQPVSKIQLNSL